VTASVLAHNKATVTVLPGSGQPTVKSIGPDHKVRPLRGEVVEWTFTNQTRSPLKLKVGNFRAHPDWLKRFPTDTWDNEPLEGECLTEVTVDPGATVKRQGRAKANATVPRTYKYDILGDGKIVLDPVLEIPN
jgi:hypothetical protein